MATAAVLDDNMLRANYSEGLERTMDENLVDEFALVGTSNSAQEEYGFVDQAAPFEEAEAQSEIDQPEGFRITVQNKRRTARVEELWINIQRDKTGQIMREKFQGMGVRAAQIGIQILTGLMANGASASAPAFDGLPFYSGSGAPHLNGDGDDIVNDLTASEVSALNVTDPANPEPDEFELALLSCIQHMMGFQDRKGMPTNDLVHKWVVHGGISMFTPFQRAARKNRLAGGESNVLLVNSGPDGRQHVFEFRTSAFLGQQANKIWIHAGRDGAGGSRPFLYQVEHEATIHRIDAQTAIEYYSRTGKVGAFAEWYGGAGYGNIRKSARATFS